MEPRILHTGTAQVLVPLTVEQMVELAIATTDLKTRELLLTAIELIDYAAGYQLREAWR